MLRLTKLEIRKFDGVEPTTLTFGPGFNVLLGKNATGKTTLLEIIAAILRDDLEPLLNRSQEIQIAFELSTDDGPMSVEVAAHPPSLALDHGRDLDTALAAAAARHVHVSGCVADIDFAFASRGGGIVDTVTDQPVQLPFGLIRMPRLLAALAVHHAQRPVRWRATNSERRLDEGLSLWDEWFGAEGASNVVRFASDGTLHTISNDAAPRALREAFHNAIGKTSSVTPERQAVQEAAEVAPLNEAVELFDLRGARLTYALRSSEPFADKSEKGWLVHYAAALAFERHDGSVFPADWLSFGQKRMLAFLLYEASTRGTPAVLDELVNGLHYEWVELCVEKLRDRQVFVTAQNPLILDLLGFESAEQVRGTFVQCTRSADGRMAWSNFTEEQAKDFYEAYEVGIQHVHEVLRSKGLW